MSGSSASVYRGSHPSCTSVSFFRVLELPIGIHRLQHEHTALIEVRQTVGMSIDVEHEHALTCVAPLIWVLEVSYCSPIFKGLDRIEEAYPTGDAQPVVTDELERDR